MPLSTLAEVLDCLPQAVVRTDQNLNVVWHEATFEQKTGIVLQAGQSLLDALERGPERDQLEKAVLERRRFSGKLLTCALKQARVQTRPCSDGSGGSWILLEPGGADDTLAFSQAFQE